MTGMTGMTGMTEMIGMIGMTAIKNDGGMQDNGLLYLVCGD